MCSSLQCLANIYHRVVKTILDDILQIAFALRSPRAWRSLLDAQIDLLVERNACQRMSISLVKSATKRFADDRSAFAKAGKIGAIHS